MVDRAISDKMSEINFRKILIKYLEKLYSNCRTLPRSIEKVNVDNLMSKIKNIEAEKGEIVSDFVQSLTKPYIDISRETDIGIINKNVKRL